MNIDKNKKSEVSVVITRILDQLNQTEGKDVFLKGYAAGLRAAISIIEGKEFLPSDAQYWAKYRRGR